MPTNHYKFRPKEYGSSTFYFFLAPSMAQASKVKETDTVIIGNGPSALILSYILHGNIPYYNGGHTDKILDQKLQKSPNLLNVTPDLYSHFRSSLKYSSTSLPINELLDTLLRPSGDTQLASKSCIEWTKDPQKAIPHMVLGRAPRPGGQWAENLVKTDPDIGTLSYADQLSLPGYSLAEHWKQTNHEELDEFIRPSRRDLASYYAAYPAAVGITDTMHSGESVSWVRRVHDAFYITSHDIRCKHIVLATGTFSINLPPPTFLEPLRNLKDDGNTVLVIGSGFTAADIIISTPPTWKIVHIYNWQPEQRPSPLKACHRQAYPEYWWIHQQMKNAAIRFDTGVAPAKSQRSAPKSDIPSFMQRDWATTYEGLPNCRILSVSPLSEQAVLPISDDHNRDHHKFRNLFRRSHSPVPPENQSPTHALTAELYIGRSPIGLGLTRKVTSFRYAVGRRGSLSYLAPSLYKEIFPPVDHHEPLAPPPPDGHHRALLAIEDEDRVASRRGSEEHDFALDQADHDTMVSLHSLRPKIEEGDEEAGTADVHRKHHGAGGLEVAPRVFAIGSLTGDSLVRFAYGGCVAVAGAIMKDHATSH